MLKRTLAAAVIMLGSLPSLANAKSFTATLSDIEIFEGARLLSVSGDFGFAGVVNWENAPIVAYDSTVTPFTTGSLRVPAIAFDIFDVFDTPFAAPNTPASGVALLSGETLFGGADYEAYILQFIVGGSEALDIRVLEDGEQTTVPITISGGVYQETREFFTVGNVIRSRQVSSFFEEVTGSAQMTVTSTSAPAPIPLPASAPLVILGLTALAALRRRKN